MLLTQGDNARAHAEFQRALALDPERPISLVSFAFERRLSGHQDEVRALTDSAVSIDPGAAFADTRRSLWRLATDVAGARADAEAAVRLRTTEYPAEAEAAWRRLSSVGGTPLLPARGCRLCCVRRGHSVPKPPTSWPWRLPLPDRDGAIAILEAVMPRGAVLWTLMRDPWFDAIRTDPRFQRLVEQCRPPGR